MVTVFILISQLAFAQDFKPNVKPTMEITRYAGTIEIDGELGDSGWENVAVADNFVENFPNNGDKPPVETEVWVTYDNINLYVAFLCYDDPGTIRASLRSRDEIWSDDYMGFIFDTYGDATMAYEVFVNPLGIQGDGLQSLHGEDINFDLVYESKGKITDIGYQVELAIPFSSLRFPDRTEQVWRATFWRTHPRDSRRTYSWAYTDNDDPCWMCQFGTIKGIKNVKPGGSFEILPSLMGFQSACLQDNSDPNSGLDDSNFDGEGSLGIKYAIKSSLVAEATYNPDFSQVESDAAQIDVNTTFALFYPEKRPFFQEGSDLFDLWYNVFYTRSINDPLLATRLTGKSGKTDFAYLVAYDEHSPTIIPFEEESEVVEGGESVSNIFRVRHTFQQNSYVGAIATDRRMKGGGAGTVLSIDGSYRFLKYYRFELQALANHAEEPNDTSLTEDINDILFDNDKHTAAYDGEQYWGHALYTSLERSSRYWDFDIDYWETSPTFRAENGFITNNSTRRINGWTGCKFYPQSSIIDQLGPVIWLGKIWNFNGESKDEWVGGKIWANLKYQTNTEIEFNTSRERFKGADFKDISRLFILVNTKFSDLLSLGFWYQFGRYIARGEDPPFLGEGYRGEAWTSIKPLSRLIIQPGLQYAKLENPDNGEVAFDGYILRTRINFQFNRELFLRLIIQYDDFDKEYDFEPLLTYRINPFTLFYIGSRHGYEDFDEKSNPTLTDRQFFMKFQYLFRL
ncbi:MAG: hypothetical protein B6D58_08065 [candidate division Zixibacteria bacterium 4484_95]|nr:MAG: hypothetical protein B6D58_08065 [candidate division Zixibacteria bacterium 4484_95]